jgi:outer membrane lipoprotein-sorting protein
MTSPVRWLLVVVVAALVTTPLALGHLRPAQATSLSATELLAMVHRSAGAGWSGEVHTQGALQVPVSDSFSGVTRLLGDETTLRVWWRDSKHWRVDRTRASGESDLVRNGDATSTWSYESEKVTFTPYSTIRLPDESDVLPSTLAARLLSGAQPRELARIRDRRVAGIASAGLRLVPADPRSTIARVDVWVDEKSGLPTQVEVYADGRRQPVLSTEVTALHVGTPAASTVAFHVAAGVRVEHRRALDEAAGANAFAPFQPPAVVAGLPRRGSGADLGAVGIYGRGPTALIAFPLRTEIAIDLRKQLLRSKKTHETDAGVGIEAGPLSVLLTRGVHAAYLLTGTVTPETLVAAAADLRTGVRLTPCSAPRA